jgi:hypothetical protein
MLSNANFPSYKSFGDVWNLMSKYHKQHGQNRDLSVAIRPMGVDCCRGFYGMAED